MMNYKNSLTKQKRKKWFVIYLSIFCTWLMFFNISNGLAVTLSCNIPEVSLTDLRIGNSYKAEDISKVVLTYTNGESSLINVAAQPLNSGFTPKTDYDVIPSIDWVSLSPSTFTIAGNETQPVSVNISIPHDIQYLGKKFQFRVWGYTTTGSARAGTFTEMNLTIGSQYIGYGLTGYDALTQIGLVGNKAYITANVASLTAPTLKLYYRKTGVTAWTTVTTATTTSKSDGTKDYTFEIPASVITTAGFQYIIESQADTDYAYMPDQIRADFLDIAKIKYFDVAVSRTTTGVISTTSSTIVVSDGNPNDGEVKITAPARAVNSNLTITMEQIDENSSACPAAPSYSLSEKPAMIFKLTPSGTIFLKNIDLSLLYFDTDNNGIVDGVLDRDGVATIEEAKLKMFGWDGFKWRLVNGTQTQDNAKNTITAKINHFSYYALFPINPLSPEDYRPAKKIITPNDDGINDEVDFNGLAEEIKIFDITGSKIKTIAAGTGQWDGKDDNGAVVESGVYIYQFKVDGTLVSGVIAVAK